MRDMRIDGRNLRRGDPAALDGLAGLRGLGADDRSALVRHTPRRLYGEKVVVIAGERFPSSFVLDGSVRICPHCVGDDLAVIEAPRRARAWMRLEWTLDHVRVCRRHGNMLVDVPWTHPAHHSFDFSRTVAGRILPDLQRLRSETVAGPGGTYAGWLLGRLDGHADRENWLDDVPLHAAAVFCEALGVSARYGNETTPSTLSSFDLARAGEEGYAAASVGRSAIESLLDCMVRDRRTRKGFQGHRLAYGTVFDVLNGRVDDPAYEKFRVVVREHAFASIAYNPGRKLLGATLETKRVFDVRAVAASLGRTDDALRRFIVTSGLASTIGVDAVAGPIPMTEADVEAVTSGMAQYMTIADVMAMTGFQQKLIVRLSKDGILLSMPPGMRPGGAYYAYRRADVEGWMARLFRDAEDVAAPTAAKVTVAEAQARAKAQIYDILVLILQGRLAWVGRLGDGTHYRNLMVDADEIVAIMRARRPYEGLFAHEALKLLPGVRAKSVTLLGQVGLLTTNTITCPGTHIRKMVFTRESVEAFAREYVSLHEITVARRVRHAHAARELKMAGVTEAVDPAKIGTPIFRRSDVAASTAFGGGCPGV